MQGKLRFMAYDEPLTNREHIAAPMKDSALHMSDESTAQPTNLDPSRHLLEDVREPKHADELPM